jgi:hypothetical protein
MDSGEKIQGVESSEEVAMIESGSGWNEKDVASAVSLASMKLGENINKKFWDGE